MHNNYCGTPLLIEVSESNYTIPHKQIWEIFHFILDIAETIHYIINGINSL